MKSANIKSSTYIDFNVKNNDKESKFEVGDHVKYKYKNIFAKNYIPNWSQDVFVIKEVKNTVPWTYVIEDLNGREIIGKFYEKDLEKAHQTEFRIEKLIKKKSNKIDVKWKGEWIFP